MTAQEIIEIIKETIEKNDGVKTCRKFQAGKALQIQLLNGDNFNLCIIKLDKKAYIMKGN